mmetsp:Transcript_82891/g.115161  ORF Transcript_82891/g.115161 Transcript_82891/m.115161 type:complete len:80 (+) Transcript_82891:1-240(+)
MGGVSSVITGAADTSGGGAATVVVVGGAELSGSTAGAVGTVDGSDMTWCCLGQWVWCVVPETTSNLTEMSVMRMCVCVM